MSQCAEIAPAFEELAAQLPPLVSPDQFEETLHVPLNTQNDWRCKGRGPSFVKLGRTIFYPRDEIIVWLRSRVFSSAAEAKGAER